jgi:hypothetical protein
LALGKLIDRATDLVLDAWPKKWACGVAAFGIAAWVFHHLVANHVAEDATWPWSLPVLAAAAVVVIWLVTTSPPRAKRGVVGLGLAIACESDAEQKRFRADFIRHFREVIREANPDTRFQVLEVRRMIAQTVDADNALQFQRKMRCHFFVFGTVRQRTSAGRGIHFLSIEGGVRHAAIPITAASKLAEEFRSALPRAVEVACSDDLAHFESTAEMLDISACYVIGLAALESGDPAYAEKVLLRARSRISAVSKAKHPSAINRHLSYVSANIPVLLAQTYERWLWALHRAYFRSRDTQYLRDSEIVIQRAGKLLRETDSVLFSRAIIAFKCHRDIAAAMAALGRCKNKTTSAWRFNRGFLLAYQGRFTEAEREYRLAVRGPFGHDSLPNQVDEFLSEVIENDDGQGCLRYFAAINAAIAKKDKDLALAYLDGFLSDVRLSEHPLLPRVRALRNRLQGRM